MLNSIGLQGPGIDAFVENDLRLAQVGRGPRRWSPSPATPPASSPTWPRSCAASRRPSTPSSASRSTSPAPTSPTAGWSSPATRWRRPRSSRWCASSCPRDIPIFAKLTPDVTDIVAIAARLREGRRRRADDDQHPAGHGHRHRPAAPAGRRRHRRAVRPGHPPGRRAGHLAGPRGDARGAAARPCRSSASGECAPAATPSSSSPPGASAVQVGTATFNDPTRPGAGRPTSSQRAPAGQGIRPLHRRRRHRARRGSARP